MVEKEEAILAAQAQSFIGSFVSLLTNKNVRYEGFVFYLSVKDSTIGIRVQKNVKSSGTEGRRKDGSQVPPSEGIYEYLYFKGTDIKGLDVKSPRPAQSTLNVLDDPAIIQGLDVKSPHPKQSAHNVLDDPAIIQSHFSPPASPSVSSSSSGALQMTNVMHNIQSAANIPYFQGNRTLHSSIDGPLASSLRPLTLNNSMPAFPTHWSRSSLSQGLIFAQPSQQQTNSSLTNVHSAPNSPNIVELHHSLIPPISPDVRDGLHAPQKSSVCLSSGIRSMTPPSVRGSQSRFPPISPGMQNGPFPVPQMSTTGSPSGLSSVPPSPATSSQNMSTIGSSSALSSVPPSPATSPQNMSTIGSPSGLSSVRPSPATSSQNEFPPVPPLSAAYSPISPFTPGSQSGIRPVPLLSVTGSPEALHSWPPSLAAVSGFALATPSPAAHSDAGLFSMPAFSLPSSSQSKVTFSGPSTPADLKTQVASSSSSPTYPLVNTDTTIQEVAGPVVPSSSMLLSVKPTAETHSDFLENDPIQPSDLLLQQEKIRRPSCHNVYNPGEVSASATLSSGSESVKEPPQQIVKLQATKKDKDVFQYRRSHWGYGKGRAKMPNGAGLHAQYGFKIHSKARGHVEKGSDGLHGARNHHGYEKGRKYLKDRDALQSGRSDWGYGNGRDYLALHPVEKFTEDFNFEAMNEKFNKEEVWGLLGESTAAESAHKNVDGTDTNGGDAPEAEDDGPVKVDNTPLYCKDDFFDTLSSNTLDQQSGRGRVKFSERRKLDSETFGEIQRHQRGRGIQGPRRAGGSQGSYRRRAYDPRGRGRGRTVRGYDPRGRGRGRTVRGYDPRGRGRGRTVRGYDPRGRGRGRTV